MSNHNGNGHISKEQLSRVDSDSDDGDEFLDTSELLVPQHVSHSTSSSVLMFSM